MWIYFRKNPNSLQYDPQSYIFYRLCTQSLTQTPDFLWLRVHLTVVCASWPVVHPVGKTFFSISLNFISHTSLKETQYSLCKNLTLALMFEMKPWIFQHKSKYVFSIYVAEKLFQSFRVISLLTGVLLTLFRVGVGWERPLCGENCLCRPVGYCDLVISVFMQFLRNQTVWNCRKVNVEAQLRVCVCRGPHSRCAGLEPLTGVSLPSYYLWCEKYIQTPH